MDKVIDLKGIIGPSEQKQMFLSVSRSGYFTSPLMRLVIIAVESVHLPFRIAEGRNTSL